MKGILKGSGWNLDLINIIRYKKKIINTYKSNKLFGRIVDCQSLVPELSQSSYNNSQQVGFNKNMSKI